MDSSQEPHAEPDTGPSASGPSTTERDTGPSASELPTAEQDGGQRHGVVTDAPEDGYFGASVAENYDDPASDVFAPAAVEPAADLLAGLAAGGPALEFGIGTGRIALPLARRGVPVHGIDLSRAMVEKLRAKPGGDAIDVTIGDFASTEVPGRGGFAVAYLVFNTIMNLTTQAEQVACFRNAAAHLAPGGTFVIEVGVPELRLLPPGQTAVPFRVTANRWAFDHYDVATQAMSSNYVEVVDGRGSYRSIPFRYVWPAELDLMAQLAGMRLRDRWEGWGREPFTNESGQHVSVWEKVAPTASAEQSDGANRANRSE
ncbi:class I SAM-dependent DNA methyltransferase (plasmid) [Streptomyces sp. CA-294286]|uniref:class I SAM-dependent DNA methyltransferase n=1 Tax=Streptomyces sp. CA-294286 TaxID=3240070 RepID=UPI003D8D51A4